MNLTQKGQLNIAIHVFYNLSKDKGRYTNSKSSRSKGNWEADSREQMIHKINCTVNDINTAYVIKVFDGLDDKICYASIHGLSKDIQEGLRMAFRVTLSL